MKNPPIVTASQWALLSIIQVELRVNFHSLILSVRDRLLNFPQT